MVEDEKEQQGQLEDSVCPLEDLEQGRWPDKGHYPPHSPTNLTFSSGKSGVDMDLGHGDQGTGHRKGSTVGGLHHLL